ncbi:MAG: DUF3224 domain-containing protein [Gemmatimonadota bacterium]|nr:DUF3224 domain-containing protein [Gemmatimonadota bacterium]
MSRRAEAMFEVKSWDEEPYTEVEGGPKLTRASVVRAYRGDIEGDSRVEYLMTYRPDGSANFVGFERIIGAIEDREGSFVLQHTGTFEKGVARAAFSVVQGSGTRDLHGLTGGGEFESGHAARYPFALDYDFA